MTSKTVVGQRLDGSGGAVALMDVARSSVWRVETHFPEGLSHGSAFAYKQVIDSKSATSKVYLLTNLHNFDHLDSYGMLVKLARRGAPEEVLTLRSSITVGDDRYHVDRIIAAKDALFTHNRPWFQDFAVIAVTIPTTDELQMFAMPSTNDAREGESIYALGYPSDTDLGITDGIISHLYGDQTPNERVRLLIQHSILLNGGNSGGPTVNPYGVAVGISTCSRRDLTGINFSVNVAHALSLLREPGEVEDVMLDAVYQRMAARACEEARYGG